MIRINVGRNDPCPCGSGRKYKKCCLNANRDEDALPSSNAASDALASLLEEVEGREFESHEELQAFADAIMQRENQTPLEHFDGLSPDIMHNFLHKPFDSPQLVTFPEELASEPDAPILTLFKLLVEAIGEKGLKATAKGNLPQKFCRETATAYWDEGTYLRKTKYSNINKEEDFKDLHHARLIFELAGLLYTNKGKFFLSDECRSLLDQSGLRAIYPRLFLAYARKFNWAYGDRYPELLIIQHAFLFTLHLLKRHGHHQQSQDFYAEAFLKAFPTVLDELESPNPYFTPEILFNNCYIWRTLHHFTKHLGLALLEPTDPDESFGCDYKVKKLPLLDEMVLLHF